MSLGAEKMNPEEAENLGDIEKQFAVKAVQHMATYWGILERMPGSQLRLTKVDDEIHEHLRREFPEFDARKPIDEDEMKSRSGKERWRKFMMTYENQISDFNFGTLIRIDSRTEYGEKETIFVPRMQFYAIEIARNREGLNDWIYEAKHPEENQSLGADTPSKDTATD